MIGVVTDPVVGLRKTSANRITVLSPTMKFGWSLPWTLFEAPKATPNYYNYLVWQILNYRSTFQGQMKTYTKNELMSIS